jgi:hypothetical protein
MQHEETFDESVRGWVRQSPWWMISAALHAALLAVLWSIRVAAAVEETAVAIRAAPEEVKEALDELIVDPPVEPDDPDPLLPPDPLSDPLAETERESDSDSLYQAPEGVDGPTEGPFSGFGENSAIGPGGGAGGGDGPGGRRKRPPGMSRTDPTEVAVDRGLRWLALHQDVGEGGMWDCDGFMKHDPADDRCDGAGKALFDPGVSGLALLAFLGAGYTDRGTEQDNRFARNVRAGLRYLLTIQDDEGCIGPRSSQHFMYNHTIAALALTEAYWMTRNPACRKPAQQAINFISMARNPYLAWRYNPRGGENDTSVTGWCVMALKSGKFAGLEIDPDAFAGARLWIDKMTDPDFGQVGYVASGGPPARPEGMQDRFPAEKSQSMTAVGVLSRIFLGEDPRTSDMIRKGTDLCLRALPRWDPDDGSIDMYYWYYGTLAMYQVGGTPWKKWNEAMKEAIVDHQHPKGSGARDGSWDPIDPWGPDGGRVYSTACMVLCLEVYYRYDRVIGARAEPR